MKTARRVVSILLSLFVCLPQQVFAVSLYDGLKAPEASTAPLAPVSPLASTPAVDLPETPTLPGAASSLVAPITAAQIPQAIQPAARAAAPAAQLPGATAALHTLVPRQSGQASNGGSESGSSDNAAASSVFDGSIVDHGVEEFFGALGAEEQAGVVVAKTQTSPDAAPGDAEMNGNVKSSPKSNHERENAVAALFARGGAAYDPASRAASKVDLTRYDAVQFQDAGRGRRNVVVVKKGKTDRVIVVGSHNDKVDVGDGVIDNWTGATMVAHLYQTLKDVETEATIVFISHAREEDGLVGSRRFVSSLSPDELARLDANINLDTLAIKGGGTYDWENNSDASMLDAADRAVAQENAKRTAAQRLSLTRAQLDGGDADSSSYRDAGVPALTIFGGLEDLVFSIIHSPRDNFGAFSLPIYKETYFVTLALLRYLDGHRVRDGAVAGR